MPSLEVHGLTVRYGLLTAVDAIDLSVAEGEVIVVLGANGAGKSSTLAAICGATRPADGTVVFAGRDVTGRRPERMLRAGLALVPEGRHVIAPLAVEDNLLLGAHVLRSRSRRRALLDEVYRMFPVLRERRRTAGGLLSGGEQQMLAFGRALMAEPSMLLLDEPSMGLAPVMVDSVMRAVEEIAARGISILMVEQNAAAAFGIASRAVILEQGRVVLEGPSAEISRDPRVLRAFLGLEEPDALAIPGDSQ
jgi:branched-chain amino acid transport system ATP-binding protein